MGTFYGSTATAVVREAVSAALNNGSIKLLGTGNPDNAELNGKSDAAYLATLLNELHEQLKAKGNE
ncbi:hypothetical protein [Paraburkholderia sp. BL21I4N1]|uniref:hypothetical protein n=1 Tax=Paraburkholderia sp. BL21I4N1 TaxID=1938801 RepID=UPI000CFB63F5|nr:hypothetical protein [Paraburkholderia sp. BL21I4N1]PQV50984.1 hypothetical protein B0G83_105347 [Paraburkholderia sp. BL21I4N1]